MACLCLMKLSIDFVKSDALRRLRPFLHLDPAGLQGKARADFEEAIRAYLADVVKAHLFALIEGHVLDPSVKAFFRRRQEKKARNEAHSEAPQLEQPAPPLTWDKDVAIIFLSDERVQVNTRRRSSLAAGLPTSSEAAAEFSGSAATSFFLLS